MKQSKKDHTADAHTGKKQTNPLSSKRAKYAGAAIKYGNCVILAKRIEICPYSKKPPPYPGYWSVFCGAIEKGENPKQAAARELFEETGLKFPENSLKRLGQLDDLELFYVSVEERPIINLNYEHTEFGFFKIDSLFFSPDPIDEKVIKLIHKSLM
jgi:8-oxo-dGTP pyrophosphatase MutT (NUDIX family)